ncbi:hypothetical protein BC833DRAFT_609223, partial [Globomyces pollinis-pini]
MSTEHIEMKFSKTDVEKLVKTINLAFPILLFISGLCGSGLVCVILSIILYIADITRWKVFEKYALFLFTFTGRAMIQLVCAYMASSNRQFFLPFLFTIASVIFALIGHFDVLEFPAYKTKLKKRVCKWRRFIQSWLELYAADIVMVDTPEKSDSELEN